MAVNITKEMTMGELLSIDRGVAVVLMNAGSTVSDVLHLSVNHLKKHVWFMESK